MAQTRVSGILARLCCSLMPSLGEKKISMVSCICCEAPRPQQTCCWHMPKLMLHCVVQMGQEMQFKSVLQQGFKGHLTKHK